MPSLLTSGFAAFLLCLAFTPLLRFALLRLRQPQRRARALPANAPAGDSTTPRLGGVAVLAAAAFALALPIWFHWSWGLAAAGTTLRPLAWPVLLVLLVGAADDWRSLPPALKFAGQIAAAALVVGDGIRVHAVFHHTLPFELSALLTVVWLVGCTNAFNLIDGLDGLATGLALFATGTVLAHAVLIGEPGLALVMGVLFGALCGFLLFNFPPASVYLGDAGSLSVGFLLGCMALIWANKATTMIGLVAPFFALLVPMLDTAVAIVRRALIGQPLFAGDHRHIHHRLLGRGLSPRRAVLVLYAAAGVGAVVSLLLADLRQRQSFELVILLFVVLAGVGVQQLGYTEFTEVGRLLRRGLLDPRKTLQAQVTLQHWGQEIEHAADYAQVWECLCQIARSLDFHGLEFRAGSAAAPRWRRRLNLLAADSADDADAAEPAAAEFCGWRCQIPLGPDGGLGQVIFWRELSPAQPGFVDDVAGALRAALAPRLQGLQAPPPRAASAGRS